MDERDASTAEVIWTWLSHEHRFKRTLHSVANALSLQAVTAPSDLVVAHLRTVMASVEIDDTDYRRAVLLTVEDMGRRSWVAMRMGSVALGRVFAQLPDGFLAAGDYAPAPIGRSHELLSGWLEYLRVHSGNAKARADAEGHVAILGELNKFGDLGCIIVGRKGDEPAEFIVNDGRHRLFAILDSARAHADVVQRVFRER